MLDISSYIFFKVLSYKITLNLAVFLYGVYFNTADTSQLSWMYEVTKRLKNCSLDIQNVIQNITFHFSNQ